MVWNSSNFEERCEDSFSQPIVGRWHVTAEGAPDGDAVVFLRHKIYKNYVSTVEAGMGMEGQIMCVEHCTF